MKLYFPTSSLNFNDIFATESISPKAFYQIRSFGTKRHFQTELSFNDNSITLFLKPPYFELANGSFSEYEEYPIIFEIDIDVEQYKLSKLSDDIYITTRTIYFSKSSIKVIFLSQIHLNIILAKSKLVNETKLVQKYIDRFEVRESLELHKFKIPKDKVSFAKDRDIIEKEIEKDRIFNGVKGFYYSYISRRYMQTYKERNMNHKVNIEGVLKTQDLLNYYEKISNLENEVIRDILSVALKYAKKELQSSKKELDKIINSLNTFKINRNEIEFSNYMVKTNDETKVYEIIINSIIKKSKSKVGDIEKNEILELISLIGQKITEEFGEKSIYRKDSISIYQKVTKRMSDIDANAISTNVLKNFLAFILKYDNVEELEKYIKYKNINNDYIAYSFLGAFLGFSGLSRIVTHQLFNCDSEDFFEITDQTMNKFRKEIWKSEERNLVYTEDVKSNKAIAKQDSTNTNISLNDNKEDYITNLIEMGKSNYREKDYESIRKRIYGQINRIRKNKKINELIKKTDIIIDENTEVKIEKSNKDIEVIILDSRKDIVFNIWLKYRGNLKPGEKVKFKNELAKIGVDDFKLLGNYPICEYNKTVKDGVSSLNYEEETYLLKCLKQL